MRVQQKPNYRPVFGCEHCDAIRKLFKEEGAGCHPWMVEDYLDKNLNYVVNGRTHGGKGFMVGKDMHPESFLPHAERAKKLLENLSEGLKNGGEVFYAIAKDIRLGKYLKK